MEVMEEDEGNGREGSKEKQWKGRKQREGVEGKKGNEGKGMAWKENWDVYEVQKLKILRKYSFFK